MTTSQFRAKVFRIFFGMVIPVPLAAIILSTIQLNFSAIFSYILWGYVLGFIPSLIASLIFEFIINRFSKDKAISIFSGGALGALSASLVGFLASGLINGQGYFLNGTIVLVFAGSITGVITASILTTAAPRRSRFEPYS